jgi:predicted TIM-barrel fold metal-dependent hydrolase
VIVDFHAHVLDEGWLPQAVWDGFLPLYQRLTGSQEPTPAGAESLFRELWDPDGSRLVAEMDRAGVDVSVILPMDQGFELGESPVSIHEQNERTAEICARHPGRLVWFYGIDPRRPHAAEHFERALERGALGLKLYPPAGFYPADDVCQPLFQVAIAHDVPVIAHCGPASAPLRSRFAHPLSWDEVAARLPSLKIVLGHGGKIEAWARDAVAIAIFKPNIHLDISLWQGWLPEEELAAFLDFMRLRLGPDRILWASDRFGMDESAGLARWRAQVQSLPERTEFTHQDVDLVMGGNALRLLRISEEPAGPDAPERGMP